VKFYVGLPQPAAAQHFKRAFVSVNRLRGRTKLLGAKKWIMDSGAFTELSTYGQYRHTVEEYAEQVNRWTHDPALVCVVSQDYMCEPFIIAKTGLSVHVHQVRTIERYEELLQRTKLSVMPVLQGYEVKDYLRHVKMYGGLLPQNAYVGVGSICKRNINVGTIAEILTAIKDLRPDIRLHGFGLKITSLASRSVQDALESADSMSWSFAARINGRDQNDWREAKKFVDQIERLLR